MVYKYHSDSSAGHSTKSMLLQSIPLLAAFFLIAPGLVVHAQQDEVVSTQCAASTLAGYDFQVAPKSDFTLYWNLSPDLQEVSFKAVLGADLSVWMAVGFSSDGDMIGSDAVVGYPIQGEVLEYELGSKSLPVQPPTSTVEPSVRQYADQEITRAAVERSGGATSLSFTRPTMPLIAGKQALLTGSSSAILLWAIGLEETLGYHSGDLRGAFMVDLFCAGAEAPAPSTTEPITAAPSTTPDANFFSVSPTVFAVPGFRPFVLDQTTSGASAMPRANACWADVGSSVFSVFLGSVAMSVATAFLHKP